MDNGKKIGMALFIGGIILLIGYGIIEDFDKIMSIDFIPGFLIGITIIGFLTLLVSIAMEQRQDTKATMKDIKKEDLEP